MARITTDGEVLCGIQLPIQTLTHTIREQWEPDATVDDLVAIAQAAEAAGLGFVGVCDHIAESLRYTHELGTSVLHLRFRSRDVPEYLDQIARFAAEVLPSLAD